MDKLLDAADLPLHQPYLKRLQSTGVFPLHESRWMNAASAYLTNDQIEMISRFPFVERVTKVAVLRGKEFDTKYSSGMPQPFGTDSYDYGPSSTQLHAVDVPPLHGLGITGHNVIIGMLDTGFRWRGHEALATRHVIAERDFIQNDDTTGNQAGDASNQDFHGTLTMSTIGGFMPGKLLGPAFDAGFVLAKTEYVPVTDYQWEEDNWANGIEWEEAQGVDVVSSSIGYNTFVDSTSYTWAHGDFNGRTTISSAAAIRAARLGVIVCNAMGNEGNGDGTVGTMLTPADADSILSVGAVYYSGLLASFSSTGPTNDGRTKPDVVAPGVSVYYASTAGFSAYGFAQGTSLATPLTGGCAALILSARPELTPIQVRDAIRATAIPLTDSARYPASPNNFTGWGLVDAFAAALSFGPIFGDLPETGVLDSASVLTIFVASRFGINQNTVRLHYAPSGSAAFDSVQMNLDSSMYYRSSGRYRVTVPRQVYGTPVRFYFSAADSSSLSYQNPAPSTGNVWQLSYGVTGVQVAPPQGYALLQNFPNPFNPETKITYDLPRREHVRVQVFNVLGQLAATLLDEVQDAGAASSRAPLRFSGADLPSGVYFYRIITPSFTATKKMLLIR